MGQQSVVVVVVEFFGWQIASLGLVLALDPWVPQTEGRECGDVEEQG